MYGYYHTGKLCAGGFDLNLEGVFGTLVETTTTTGWCTTLQELGAKIWYLSPPSQPDYFESANSNPIQLESTTSFLFSSNGGFTIILKFDDHGSRRNAIFYELHVDNFCEMWLIQETFLSKLMFSVRNLETGSSCDLEIDYSGFDVIKMSITFNYISGELKAAYDVIDYEYNELGTVLQESARDSRLVVQQCHVDAQIPDIALSEKSSSAITHKIGGLKSNFDFYDGVSVLDIDLYGLVVFDNVLSDTMSQTILGSFEESGHTTWKQGSLASSQRTTLDALNEFQGVLDSKYPCQNVSVLGLLESNLDTDITMLVNNANMTTLCLSESVHTLLNDSSVYYSNNSDWFSQFWDFHRSSTCKDTSPGPDLRFCPCTVHTPAELNALIQVHPVDFQCLPCPAGSFKNALGNVSCTPCPLGTFIDEGALACTHCPNHTVTLTTGNQEYSDCVCDAGLDGGPVHDWEFCADEGETCACTGRCATAARAFGMHGT